MKGLYKDALDAYIAARKELLEATKAYDNTRHAMRVALYKEKMEGVKYTEEQIRSTTITACKAEKDRYEDALAACEIAKETLEFFKTTYNTTE